MANSETQHEQQAAALFEEWKDAPDSNTLKDIAIAFAAFCLEKQSQESLTTSHRILFLIRSKIPASGITVNISDLRSTLIPFEITTLHKSLPDISPEIMSRCLKGLCAEGLIHTFDMDLIPIYVPANKINIAGFGLLNHSNISFANKP